MLIHIFTYFLIPPIDHVISLKHSSSSFRFSIQSRWKTVVVLWRILFQPIDTICQSSWPIRDETLWAAARRGGRDTQEFIYFTLLVGKRKPTNPEEVIITTSDHTFTFITQRAEFYNFFLSGCHCYAKKWLKCRDIFAGKKGKIKTFFSIIVFFSAKQYEIIIKWHLKLKLRIPLWIVKLEALSLGKWILQKLYCKRIFALYQKKILLNQQTMPQGKNIYDKQTLKKNFTFLCLINWIN